MSLKKQEFYEGAALHLLARSGNVKTLRYEPPLFVVNDDVLVLLKYCTRGRSPWGFTFTGDEQILLDKKACERRIVIGLICGADGVAAFDYEAYRKLASPRQSPVHIACYRGHNEHYQVNGPDGTLDRKVPPSNWQRIIFSLGVKHETS